MKAERFIIEFANFCLRELENNENMNTDVKNDIWRKIARTVNLRQNGLITAREAMQLILDAGRTENNV